MTAVSETATQATVPDVAEARAELERLPEEKAALEQRHAQAKLAGNWQEARSLQAQID